MKRFCRPNPKTIFGLLSIVIFCFALAPTLVHAESEPKTEYLTPIPPDASICWHYFELYSSELSKPGGQPVVPMTEFYACMQAAGGQWNDYLQTVNDYWYRRSKQIQQSFEFQVKLAGWGAAMDAISFITTKIASDAANKILGVDTPEGEANFFEDPFGDSLKYAGDNAAGVFFERFDSQVNQFRANSADQPDTQNSTFYGFTTLCNKPSPLDIQMGIGLGPMGSLNPPTCTLSAMAKNFEAIADMVSSGDALNIHKATFDPQGDDLSVGIEVHANYVDSILEAVNAKKLERQETQGMKPFADKITGKIMWPSMMGNESMKNLDPVGMSMMREQDQAGYMFDAYWQTGLEGIGVLTLSTFLNRLAFGFLDKLFNPEQIASGGSDGQDPTKYTIIYNNLVNEDATGDTQNYYERQAFAKALGDFVVPSYYSDEAKDLVSELSVCPAMRNKWNCSMDQALAIAINLGTNSGATTIGKAAGIGNENSNFSTNNQGLHPDWELIPESDIVNNSDPSCYQRAYCAGNLKKLRLARILPTGFELAANSPYNVKRSGKYVTLGDVIRGFYDCNDKGKLDKDHPWCHLINPNWILTSPSYQCRTKGYGDTLMPDIGTRQEECGDVASCLGTNQKGECDQGYGYCLAERTSYKFDTPDCKEQYASCRTYQSSKGETLSALRYTVERGACSAENIGCMWFATNRYVTSSASPDGLWEGTLTEGSRVYLDGAVEPCSSEGCTKVFNVKPGESAFNLINNSSFEKVTEVEQSGTLVLQGIDAWDTQSAVLQNIDTTKESYDGTRGMSIDSSVGDEIIQIVRIQPNRNYTFSYYSKNPGNISNGNIDLQFGNIDNTTGIFKNSQGTEADIAFFEDCAHTGGNVLRLRAVNYDITPNEWQRNVCQFVSPLNSAYVEIRMAAGGANGLTFDALSLEEGEYATDYVEELAELPESHIKIAPDEYQCTGNDNEDHPACKNFARACYQTEIGCQGYTDVNDPTAPEIPATLTAKDYCPSVCSGYGEYRKLASAFDLVYNPVYPQYSDPSDNGKAYLIPSASQTCTLQNVGCEPFTSLEAASQGGEQVAYYDDLRTCQKPNDSSRTYFTWEGSDAEGYVLRTWALIASAANNAPKVVLKGAMFGDIKDPATCNEDLWSAGIDQDCRQFYDETGAVYYAYYSQTVSSDSACTLYRKDDSSEVDCTKTGGHEFVPQSGSCLYYALPSESTTCPATAGGCRAYLGPTGRNAVQTYYQTFMEDASASGFASGLNSAIARSEESVLVGDYSLRVDAVGGSNIEFHTDIPLITTTTLYRVSFWAKSLGTGDASVTIDGQTIGSFKPTTIWQRFEFGPFEVEDSTSTLAIAAPQALGSIFIDTIKLDQLNDVRFLIKNSWVIPAACDATAEGTPEPRAMLGCSEYIDRDGNQIFARNFSNLCRADSIGCKAFIDTRSVNNPYPETRTITGTPGPSQRNDADARTYEEQYLGDWSVTSGAWRYYYAIDDSRARCDESQSSCRAFGKPRFTQDRLSLKATEYSVDPADTELLQTQDIIYEFETVLLKHNWDAYYNDDGSLNLACRKDELHCDRFQSGNVTEFFRNPGEHTCEWRDAKQLEANPGIGIYTAGTYGGWFRKGTDTPCYPGDDTETPPKAPYLKNGDNFGAYFTGEDQYAGWVSNCPVDQSECTEFVDPNDTSDSTNPLGRSYFLINSNKLDTRSCGYQADPLAGCILFNNKSIGEEQVNSRATYKKSIDERGAPQNPIDCKGDPENPYCKVCINYVFKNLPAGANPTTPAEFLSVLVKNDSNSLKYYKELLDYERKLQSENYTCVSDEDCLAQGSEIFSYTAPAGIGYAVGSCGRKNDSNVVIKVKLDRECARWMGCRTGETVYDPAQQKYVNKCSDLEICEKNGSKNEDIFCSQFTDRTKEDLLKEGQFINLSSYSDRIVDYGALDYSGYTIPNQYLIADTADRYVGLDLMTSAKLQELFSLDKRLVAEIPMSNPNIAEYSNSNIVTQPVCRDFKIIHCTGYGCDGYHDDIKNYIGDACTTNADCYIEEHDLAYTAQGNCGLSLCQDIRSGLIGYRDLIKDVCVLSIGASGSSSLVNANQSGGDLSRNADVIYDQYIQNNITKNNSNLQSAMPAPECQLYPEANSPLTNEYVETWNNKTTPAIPEKMFSGFEGAKACIYGEDCSCSYRKVRYDNGVERFYATDGSAPSVGVCVGGESEGQACVPGGYVPVDGQNRVLVSTQQANTLQKFQACAGGVCSAIQDVVIQNGQYGYCLERDKTRVNTGNQLIAPCLTWSPQVVIGGKYDITHFSPTAGYLPPQGSGEYYCTSGANEQKIIKPNVQTKFTGNSWESENFVSPGRLERFAYSLPNVWSNVNSNAFDNNNIDGKSISNSASYIDNFIPFILDPTTGQKTAEKQSIMSGQETKTMEFACRRAALCSGYPVTEPITEEWFGETIMPRVLGGAGKGSDLDSDPFEGRWITTGSGPTKSYMEYFIINKKGTYGINEKEFDYHYGLFRFAMNPYSAGAACKWNPVWAGQFLPSIDGDKDFSCEQYLSKIDTLSNNIYQQISSGFNGIVDRSSERILTNGNDEPVKLTCVQNGKNNPSGDSSCYYKYWEVGYKDQDQQKFVWVDTVKKDPNTNFSIMNSGEYYFARECSSKNPYFSIRAMFENVNQIENGLPIEEARSVKLSGPWQFVGFWITTCAPTNNANDPAHLYLKLDYVKASVCTEVAQVISPTTRENAAFADRVWSMGNFILPTLGLDYSTRNEPFASALAAGKIGNDPMLMGVSVPTSGDFSKAPSFVDSGVSIQSVFIGSQNAWAPLSNLFARIYKVYRWAPRMVTKYDWACIRGSKMGFWCNPGANAYQGIVDCGDYATCSDEIDIDQINQLWKCNSLSGVNRGLSCGSESVALRNTDPICHNAAVYIDPNDPDQNEKPIYSTCQPGNLNKRNLLAYSLKTDAYVLDDGSIAGGDPMKDIRFLANKCPAPNSDPSKDPSYFYITPINPGIDNRRWDDPLVLLFGLLKISKQIDDSGGDIDPCGESVSGQLTELLQSMKDQVSVRAKFMSTLGSESNSIDFTGFSISTVNNANEAAFQTTLQKYIDDWINKDDYYSLGQWQPNHLQWIIDYRCDDDSVNAGHRCLPGANVGEGGSFEGYRNSSDCPKKITACAGGVTDADSGTPSGTANDGIPDCGYCDFSNDEYKDLYKFKGQQTGHCQYFNDFSRCTTNADCTFTEFEYWGAHDDENPSPEGQNLDELAAELPFLHSKNNVLNLNYPPIPMANLPRPLFKSSLYATDEKLYGRNPYDIPRIYSEPTILSTFTNNGTCALKVFSGKICRPILVQAEAVIAQNPGHVGTEVEQMMNDLKSWDNTKDAITDIGTIYIAPGVLGIEGIKAILDLLKETSKDRKESTVGLIAQQLAEDYKACYQECVISARTVPNGYASHFEDIVQDSKNQKLRSGTIAPFIVNTLYREVRSMGYQTVKTDSYSENEDGNCGGVDSLQGRQVISYLIQGKLYTYLWRFMYQPSMFEASDGDCGTDDNGYADAEYNISYEAVEIPATDFAVTSAVDPTNINKLLPFMDDYAKTIGQVGFSHRLSELGQASLLNDSIPWKVDTFFFTSIFPLMTENQKVLPMDTDKFQYDWEDYNNGKVYPITPWRQGNKIIQNLGISKELVQALSDYLYNLSQSVILKGKTQQTQNLERAATQAAFNKLSKIYKEDFSSNFIDKTGWGALLDEDYKELNLFPGAVPVVHPADGKDIPPLYLPGHCEPPTNGTDYDSVSTELMSINTAMDRQDKWWSEYGRPTLVAFHKSHDDAWWSNKQMDFRSLFISAWEPVKTFREQIYHEYADGEKWAFSYKDQENNSPVPRFCDHVISGEYYQECDKSGYKVPENHEFVLALLNPNYLKDGENLPISGRIGPIAKDVTTCRCEGGKYDGQPKGSQQECNQGLADEEDPNNYDPNASSANDPSDFCVPVSNPDLTPQSYCRSEVGTPGHPDPDLDDNWCTHRPGYVPRGDVCADGREICLTAYNLTDPLSTNHISNEAEDPRPKTAPSATDVTSGLDTYKFLTGTYDPYVPGRDHISDKKFTVYYHPRPPRLAAPDQSRQSASASSFPVSSMDSFSINGLANGLVYYGGGQGLSTIRFYAWATHDQGPLKQVIIDWGDGSYQNVDNAQLKNRKPVCNTTRECEFIEGFACSSDADCPPAGGKCLEKGTCKKKTYLSCDSDDDCGNGDECETRMFFGNSSEACQQGYFEFNHVYKCTPEAVMNFVDQGSICDETGLCENEPGLTCNASSDCRAGEECITQRLAKPDGCYNQVLNRCRFTPRVMVVDNWGWCTGDCTREDEVKPGDPLSVSKANSIRHFYGGCWDGSQTKINSEILFDKVISAQDPYYGLALPNECKPYFEVADYFSRATVKQYRPWIVFDGSVEISLPD